MYSELLLFVSFICNIYAISGQAKQIIRRQVTAPPCDLPPDFWCDHPETSISCTGSLDFCQKYRANRAGRRLSLELAFETACPDSQECVVNRLYPKILTNPQLAALVDFKALPWGLATRNSENKVNCHHGERECIGNRLLRAALYHLGSNEQQRNALLNCFMSRMMYRPPDPTPWMAQCLDHLRITPSVKTAILNNKNVTLPDLVVQERADEAETRRIGPPRFVPFIAINGRGHIHMQAHQMILGDKIRAWNHTVASMPARTVVPSNCHTPPDFWCADDASFSADCYTARGCADYTRAIFNKPVHLRVLYNSQAQTSQRYVLDYLRRHFIAQNPFDMVNAGKFILELEPFAVAGAQNINANANCAQEPQCMRRAFEECIASKVENARERTNLLVCLLSGTQAANLTISNVGAAWTTCARVRDVRETVEKCVRVGEWRQLFIRRAAAQQALRPQPPQWSPWVVLNSGHSLVTVQSLNHLLHRMICIWYRGAGHDRQFCARCEYEPTHC